MLDAFTRTFRTTNSTLRSAKWSTKFLSFFVSSVVRLSQEIRSAYLMACRAFRHPCLSRRSRKFCSIKLLWLISIQFLCGTRSTRSSTRSGSQTSACLQRLMKPNLSLRVSQQWSILPAQSSRWTISHIFISSAKAKAEGPKCAKSLLSKLSLEKTNFSAK